MQTNCCKIALVMHCMYANGYLEQWSCQIGFAYLRKQTCTHLPLGVGRYMKGSSRDDVSTIYMMKRRGVLSEQGN